MLEEVLHKTDPNMTHVEHPQTENPKFDASKFENIRVPYLEKVSYVK